MEMIPIHALVCSLGTASLPSAHDQAVGAGVRHAHMLWFGMPLVL